MRDPRLGAAFRAVRIKRGLRQADVATRAGISRALVGRLESGDIGSTRLDTLEHLAAVLEIRLEIRPRWRGGELDRQLSARHAALSEVVAKALTALGWSIAPQASFSIWGERGLVDVLAWHPATRSLLVIEVKTEIVDVEEMVGTLDRKRRLAVRIAADRGWHARSVGVWVVVADSTMNRRRVASHRTLLRSAYPLDGSSMRRYLRHPDGGGIAGLSFWASSIPGSAKRGFAATKRVRVQSSRSAHARDLPAGGSGGLRGALPPG